MRLTEVVSGEESEDGGAAGIEKGSWLPGGWKKGLRLGETEVNGCWLLQQEMVRRERATMGFGCENGVKREAKVAAWCVAAWAAGCLVVGGVEDATVGGKG
ncbi:hypothetical protein AMTR_s00028p00164740 [Amborella trichopoda]|uniref:Uncharacterized protein n=1 Tax=Amborella trichopoda TaxID=13333 RepID=W1PRE2_AMBTC|nr:hypothetical protein AMTR_s00028p00164740 [Amborella trichopoda]